MNKKDIVNQVYQTTCLLVINCQKLVLHYQIQKSDDVVEHKYVIALFREFLNLF